MKERMIMNATHKINIALNSLLSSPWAIKRSAADTILFNIFNKYKAEKNGELIIGYCEGIKYEIVNGKAIIDVSGIFYNKCMLDEDWGYVKCDLEKTLIAAVDDINVIEVILKIYSPGGFTYGVPEIHNLIKELKKVKPINAYINGCACSALYWIPSACSNIYAYEQSDIGSIGVYAMHVDYSEMLKDIGIKIQYIQAGSKKTVGHPYEPLSVEDRKYLQENVNQAYKDFTEAVADARNLNINDIEIWADGKYFETKQALELGLIDEIKSWQDVLGNKISDNSFITSLKTVGSRLMAIGEKKISELNAEDLQNGNSGLYASIYETGYRAGQTNVNAELTEKNTALHQEVNDLKTKIKSFEDAEKVKAEQQQIRDFATSLNLTEEGETLIKENKTVVEAFSFLAEEAKKAKTEQQASFIEGAPNSAGNGGDSMSDNLPKNSAEAITFCQDKYKCTKKEAWKKARLEFSNLFGNTKVEESE